MNKVIEKWLEKIRNPKVLIAMGIAGILLIALSSFIPKNDSQKEKTETEFSADSYREALEKDIKELVYEITGDKKASVVVTLDGSLKYTYADTKEEIISDKSGNDSESSQNELKAGYVTVKTADGGEEALLVTAELPTVRGVAIVCEGGDNEILNEKIQNTVTAALDITKKRVNICGRNLQ